EKDLTVTVYNPLGHKLHNHTIRFPVKTNTEYRVFDEQNLDVASYLVPIPEGVQNIRVRPTVAKAELVFSAKSIPPLGFVRYAVRAVALTSQGTARQVNGSKIASTGIKLQSKNLQLIFDASGEVSQVQLKDGSKVSFRNEFHYYKGAHDNVRSSGAYVFRPSEQTSHKVGKVVHAEVFQN